MLGNFITLSLSVYSRFQSSGTIFVAFLCTFSICCCSLLSDGTQAAFPYSSMGLMRLVYSFLMVPPSLYVYARRIMPNILFALLVTVSTCWLKLHVWVNLHSKVSLVCGHSYLSVSAHVVLIVLAALKRSCHFLFQSSRRLRSDCRTSLSVCLDVAVHFQ